MKLTLLTAAVAVLGLAAPASADPWPYCQSVSRPGRIPPSTVCVDPTNDRCLAYGGGEMWNFCVVNPL